MDKIYDLAIAYPDFQLNQIIDPDQIDLNNSQMVAKINQLVTCINAFTQGIVGAGHVTIATLPEFPTAKNVQTALSQIATYCKANNTSITQILQKDATQDGKITALELRATNVENKNTSQDGEITGVKTRLTAVESKNAAQQGQIDTLVSKTNTHETKIAGIEVHNTQQDTTLTAIKDKDAQQDIRISDIETREELDTAWVKRVDEKVETNKGDIVKLRTDLEGIATSNPAVELVEARTSGHTGQTFDRLVKRLDHIEIPIAGMIDPSKRSNVNFVITDTNSQEAWESGIVQEVLNLHNNSAFSHPILVANHELNENSHKDIRDAMVTKGQIINSLDATEVGNVLDATQGKVLDGKIQTLSEKDTALAEQFNVLNGSVNVLDKLLFTGGLSDTKAIRLKLDIPPNSGNIMQTALKVFGSTGVTTNTLYELNVDVWRRNESGTQKVNLSALNTKINTTNPKVTIQYEIVSGFLYVYICSNYLYGGIRIFETSSSGAFVSSVLECVSVEKSSISSSATSGDIQQLATTTKTEILWQGLITLTVEKQKLQTQKSAVGVKAISGWIGQGQVQQECYYYKFRNEPGAEKTPTYYAIPLASGIVYIEVLSDTEINVWASKTIVSFREIKGYRGGDL